MTNKEFIEKLYKKKDDLIRICNYHGIFNQDCEDTIQDLYIKLFLLDNNRINRYSKDDEPNMFIIFAILRNMISNKRKKDKHIFIELDENIDIELENEEVIDLLNIISVELNKIKVSKDKLYDMYWFHKKLLTIYIDEHHSIRSLAKATNITTWTIQKIFNSFKLNCIKEYNKLHNQK